MANYQVVIVGGGPVGVALAVDLGQRGVRCLVVERRTELQNIPKGQNLTPRTLEHFYSWGCLEQLRAARIMPKGYPESGITAYKNMMSEYWYAPPQREIVKPYYFQANDRLPQYLTEGVLRKRMAELPSVESAMGRTVSKIEQDVNGVRVTIDEDATGRQQVVECEFCVGCDGSRSMVREEVGIERSGADFDQVMVLAVFRSKELHEGFKRFPDRSTYRAMDPELKGYWQFFGRIDVGEGWFFHAPVPAGTTRDNYDFKGLIERAAGFSFHAEFDHVGFWDLRVAVAEKYQVGRVLIAGDAAHTHPPYGGFGLNNGLEDAANLGWKLAATVQGWGGAALLPSYGEERRTIFHETGRDFIASRIEEDRDFLDTYSPDKDKAQFEREWAKQSDLIGGKIMTYEPNYEGSPVVMGPPGGKSSAHGSYTYKARAGHHLPPRTLSTGKNVFEELGRGFTLLAFDSDTTTVGAFQEAAKRLNIPFKAVRDAYSGERKDYQAKLILVRPEQYVVWCGDKGPEDINMLLRRAVGRV